MITKDLCSYGCGRESVYTNGFGKHQCEINYKKCPILSAAASKKRKEVADKQALKRYGTNDLSVIAKLRSEAKADSVRLGDRKKRAAYLAVMPAGTLCHHGCGNPATYAAGNIRGRDKGFRYVCHENYTQCPVHHAKSQVKYKATSLVRYGVENISKDRPRSESRMMELYGVSCVGLLGAPYRAKAQATNMARYGVRGGNLKKRTTTLRSRFGVDNVFQLEEVKAKGNITKAKLYGDQHIFSSKTYMASWRQKNVERFGQSHPNMVGAPGHTSGKRTTMEHLGVEHAMQSPEIQAKVRATNMKNWGTPHTHQSSEFYRGLSKTVTYRYKDHTTPSGQELRLQGYEPQALDWLLAQGIYAETDFDFDAPVAVPWVDARGHERVYHPDFVIPAIKTLIEVKSTYFMKTDRDRITRKAQACAPAGWDIQFVISPNGRDFTIHGMEVL